MYNSRPRGAEAEWEAVMVEGFTALPREELIARLREAGIAFAELRGADGLADHPALRRTTVATGARRAPPLARRGAALTGAPREGGGR